MQSVPLASRPALSDKIIGRIRHLLRDNPDWSRGQIARQVCQWTDWKFFNGKYQEMNCRLALLKLHREGVLILPDARGKIPPYRVPVLPAEQPSAITCSLQDLSSLEIVPVDAETTPMLSGLWNQYIAHYHYLGYQPLVGAQKRYLIRSEQGFLGALGFSAASWALKSRDDWIGWSFKARQTYLKHVVCNSRFLILPHVRVKNLASRVLSLVLKRLPKDWQEAYGYQPVLVETYVEKERFAGTSYRATNWIPVGQTQGRGRNDSGHKKILSIKDVYVYPLKGWQDILRQEIPEVPSGETKAPEDWAEEEFGKADLGDERRTQRLLTMARDFYARPQANIPQACGSRAKTKAAYRFLECSEVKMEALLKSHHEATEKRVALEKVVLAAQDTTFFNYDTHRETAGLGLIGTSETGPVGIVFHGTLALNTQGVALGLLQAQSWVRKPEDFHKNKGRTNVPIEEKESYKWLKSYQAVAEVQKRTPGTTLVSVGDRESDIYELFLETAKYSHGPRLLVRAERNRAVGEEQGHLWEHLESQPLAGTVELHLPKRKKQSARVAFLEIRFARVTLKPPGYKKEWDPIQVWAVLAREVNPPEKVEPIEWMLLTTWEVKNLEEAFEKLKWYGLRWQIEVYHKVLKSGVKIEQRQLGNRDRIESCLAIDLVVAWRILHLTRLGRQTPDVPCTVYFEDYEWRALYGFVKKTTQVPEQVPCLRDAIRTVAGLGGFLGRKGDGEPGTQTLWLGLQRLDDIAHCWLEWVEPHRKKGPTSPVSSRQEYG